MPTSPFVTIVLLLMLVIKTASFGFKGNAGIGSLLLLFPLYLCLVTVSDSLSSRLEIRSWNKHRGGFDWIKKNEKPFQYWLEILISWLGAAILGYLFLVF